MNLTLKHQDRQDSKAASRGGRTSPDRLRPMRRKSTVEALEPRTLLAVTNLTGLPVSAVEGLPFVHQEVATFNDSNSATTASSSLATIDWGDGHSSAGEIIEDASKLFHVSGSHTYTEQGSFPIGVTIDDGTGQTILGFFTQTPLVSNIPGRAPTTDPNLVNPWGLDASPSGSAPWWVADNGTGLSTLYNAAGTPSSLVVTVPGANPTGLVFNPFATTNPNDFVVSSGASSGAALFLFANESGEIDGWNSSVPPPVPSTVAQTAVTVPTAVFKGLAIGTSGGANYLYATDFHNGVIDVFDGTFTNVTGTTFAGKFNDPGIPAGFAPFGIQNIGGSLYVTYAKQDAAKHDDEAGPGNGFVDVFNTDGTFVKRLASGGTLNSPWGLAQAPSNFGIFSNDLLVGNFGDGRINAFDPATGNFLGQVEDNTGGAISGLWALQFGKGGAGTAGPTNTLFFTAGLNHEADGLFGNLVAQTDTLAAMATVADAPLSSQGAPIVGAEGLPLAPAADDVLVATFTDAGGADPTTDYTATITWGDGSSSPASRIVANGAPNGVTFSVYATHTYADKGSYAVQVVIADEGGSLTIAATEADIAAASVPVVPLSVSGQLNPTSDSGVSNSDAVTNVTQPNFFGTTSEPDANVFLYATPTGSVSKVLIGQSESDSNGAWSITSGVALTDGSYTITAQAINNANQTIRANATITPTLVIDTVGPKITDVAFNRFSGQVLVTFQDYGGVGNAGVGLNELTPMDATNYSLTKPHTRPGTFLVTELPVDPGTGAGPQLTTVLINGGKHLRGGYYTFIVRSVSPTNLTGVQDLAGNALDGEFYGNFPSGNNHVGGDFVARLDAIHHTIYPPRTVIGPAAPGSGVMIPVNRPSATTAVKLSGKNMSRVAASPASTKLVRPTLVRARSTLPIGRK